VATSIETLAHMEDGHLIAVLRAELDDLTSTPLEMFLLDKLEALIDDGKGGLQEVVDEYDATAGDVKAALEIATDDVTMALLKVLEGTDLNADKLTELIEFRSTFAGIANDADDFFTRLTDLINQAKE
jgi:hypothetical protein